MVREKVKNSILTFKKQFKLLKSHIVREKVKNSILTLKKNFKGKN